MRASITALLAVLCIVGISFGTAAQTRKGAINRNLGHSAAMGSTSHQTPAGRGKTH
jgi:hypothetical protein